MNILKEFRDFAMRGNVIDLAVGIIIGAAFTSIVTSLVNDVIMPVIGYLMKGVNFTDYFILLSTPKPNPDGTQPTIATLAQAKAGGLATINYGVFINAVINFLIVAFVIFMVVKQMNRFKGYLDAAPAAPSKSEELLTEIRDLLKKKP